MIKIFAAIILAMSFTNSANATNILPPLVYNITSIESKLHNNVPIIRLVINIVNEGKYVTANGINNIVYDVKNVLLSTLLTNNHNAVILIYIIHSPPSPNPDRVLGIILEVNDIQYKKLFIDRLWIES